MQAADEGFAASDTNKDGHISHDEWVAQEKHAAAMIPETSRKEYIDSLESNFKQIDADGDGNISLSEWTTDNYPHVTAGAKPLKRVS